MNKNELNKAIGEIKANPIKKRQIMEQIRQEHMSDYSNSSNSRIIRLSRKKNWVKRMTATAAALMILAIPATIYAEEIKEFFVEILGQDKQVQEYVRQNVYEDSDTHLKISVTELLSDQKAVRAIVMYEALDETGKDWINNFSEYDYNPGGPYEDTPIEICPDGRVNMAYGFRELKQYRTDTEIYLEVFYDSCDPEGFTTAHFKYPMFDNPSNEATLDVTANMDIKEYRLVGDTNISKYYDATYIRLSDLSYVVYGNQKGLFSHKKNSNGGFTQQLLVSDEEMDYPQPEVILHLKDGSTYQNNYGWSLGPVPVDEDMNLSTSEHHDSDTNIYSCYYSDSGNFEPETTKDDFSMSIKAEDIESVTINGHDFTLEEF